MTQSSTNRQPSSDSLEQIIQGFDQYQAEAKSIQAQYLENLEEVRREFSEFATQQNFNSTDSEKEQKPSPEAEKLRSFWQKVIGTRHPVAEDLYMALYRRFVGGIILEDRADFLALNGKPRLYLANHQVGIESILFILFVSSLSDSVTNILAKTEHQQSWMSKLFGYVYSYPQVKNPELIFYFQRDDPLSMLKLLNQIKNAIAEQGNSLMVHAEGTRLKNCRQPVTNLSAVFIDLALELNLPIIPVKFVGGLPVESVTERLEFPLGYTHQDYHLGKAIDPQTLKSLGNLERKALILSKLNQLGGNISTAVPNPPDLNFAQKVTRCQEQTQVAEIQAVFYEVLKEISNPTPEVKQLLLNIERKSLLAGKTPQDRWVQKFSDWLTNNPSS
ncbi:MAG: 1-acyl-sn-glycerol-3-phosphate acyltransferase [Cyanobacteria bacterium J06600_6]